MTARTSRTTWIYHITTLDNLEQIIRSRVVLCKARCAPAQVDDIASASVQRKRARTLVPIPPHGNLHDYVPFYFAPRPPMMYFNDVNNIWPASEMIYLLTSAERMAHFHDCVFTDGHAIVKLSRFFGSLEQLDQIDWAVMRDKFWNDTDTDPDRERRRQAEFLVYDNVPWEHVRGIAVENQAMADRVGVIQKKHLPMEERKRVGIKPGWYY